MSKPNTAINRYKANLREMNFLLFEQLGFQDIVGKGAYAGWGKDEDRTRTGEAGFDHHLVKPIDIKTLNAVLAGVKPRSEA